MEKIVIMGYYGFRNFGDDLMLYNITKHLHGKCEISILTSDKSNTKTYLNDENIVETHKNAKFKNFKLFLNILKRKDYLVWGGGTCFSDQDGVVSPLFPFFARMLGVKVVFIGVGANEIQNKKNKIKLKLVSLFTNKIFVRDDQSVKILEKYFNSSKIVRTEDLAYLYDFEDRPVKDNNLVVSFRNLDNYMDKESEWKVIEKLADFIETIYVNHQYDQIIVIDLDDKLDTKINTDFINNLKKKNINKENIHFVTDTQISEKIEILSNSKLNILFRLHGIFVSELSDIKTIGIGYSPKIERFMSEINSKGYVAMDSLLNNNDILEKVFEKLCISENKNIEEKVTNALKNFEFLEK